MDGAENQQVDLRHTGDASLAGVQRSVLVLVRDARRQEVLPRRSFCETRKCRDERCETPREERKGAALRSAEARGDARVGDAGADGRPAPPDQIDQVHQQGHGAPARSRGAERRRDSRSQEEAGADDHVAGTGRRGFRRPALHGCGRPAAAARRERRRCRRSGERRSRSSPTSSRRRSRSGLQSRQTTASSCSRAARTCT